eukprot:Awhi_evm1s12988
MTCNLFDINLYRSLAGCDEVVGFGDDVAVAVDGEDSCFDGGVGLESSDDEEIDK